MFFKLNDEIKDRDTLNSKSLFAFYVFFSIKHFKMTMYQMNSLNLKYKRNPFKNTSHEEFFFIIN